MDLMLAVFWFLFGFGSSPCPEGTQLRFERDGIAFTSYTCQAPVTYHRRR